MTHPPPETSVSPVTGQALESRTADALGADELAARLSRLGEDLDVVTPADVAEAWSRAVHEADRAARSTARLGVYLLWLRQELPPAEFAEGLEAQDMSTRTAQRAMATARLLLNAPDGLRVRLAKLSPSRVSALAALDVDDLSSAVEQGELDLDDVTAMPVRALRKEVRRLRLKSEDLALQADARREENLALKRARGYVAGPEFPASVVRARGEAAAFAEQAIADIGALAEQGRQLLAATDLGRARNGRAARLAAGLRPVVLHLAALRKTVDDLIAEALEDYADWLPTDAWGEADQPAPLSPGEIRELAEWREVHLRRMDAEAERREAERVGSGRIRRGRGRPRKQAVARRAS